MKYQIESAVGYVADARTTPFAAVANEFIDDVRIGALEKALFLLLARHASVQTGMAFPGYRSIAARLHCSTHSIKPALETLKRLGYLTISVSPQQRVFYVLQAPAYPWGHGAVAQGKRGVSHVATEQESSNKTHRTREEKRSLTLTQKKPPPRKEKYAPLSGLTQEVMDGIVTRRGGLTRCALS